MKEKLKKLKNQPLVKKHAEKIRFVLVGGFNTVFDFCLFSLLTNLLSFPKEIANIISTSICITISFILNYKFVWKSKKEFISNGAGFSNRFTV